jgi:hypothetical protein
MHSEQTAAAARRVSVALGGARRRARTVVRAALQHHRRVEEVEADGAAQRLRHRARRRVRHISPYGTAAAMAGEAASAGAGAGAGALLVIAMVGMPARGKSTVAKRLCAFLNWTGRKTRVGGGGGFAQMRRRRRAALTRARRCSTSGSSGARRAAGRRQTFSSASRRVAAGRCAWRRLTRVRACSPSNAGARAQRERLALGVLEDAVRFAGAVAIFDATNSTRERRRLIAAKCREAGAALLFLESICTDPRVNETNFRQKIENS